MSCCGKRRTPFQGQSKQRDPGTVDSAESMLAAANPRYLVVPRQTATDGKRFSTLTAAQDFARRSGGIIRQL